MTTLAVRANDFMALRRLALVGLSHDPRELSRALFRELRQRGYEVVPVNPLLESADGVPCARRVQEVTPAVDWALLMTPPAMTEQVVRDCAEAGVKRVWMHRGTGTGSVSPAAVSFCRDHGIEAIAGACPFLFLPRTGFVHRTHRFLSRLFGHDPGRRAA